MITTKFPKIFLVATIDALIKIIEGNSFITGRLIHLINHYIVHNSKKIKPKDNPIFFLNYELFFGLNIYNSELTSILIRIKNVK